MINRTILILIWSISFFFDGGVPSVPRVGSACLDVRFAGGSLDLGDFGCRGGALAAGLFGWRCRCFGLRGVFLRFCRGVVPWWRSVMCYHI